MSSVRGVLFLFVALAALAVALVSCGYIETEESVEAKLLEPPSVREIIDDADELGLEPIDLLERRRDAAIEDLEELYAERIDEASSDRASERLERQLNRALDQLNENYDRRLARLEDRLEDLGES